MNTALHKIPRPPENATSAAAQSPGTLPNGHATEQHPEEHPTLPEPPRTEDRLPEEDSDLSSEDDVFGEDESAYAWRRAPTVEGDEDKSTKASRTLNVAATLRSSQEGPKHYISTREHSSPRDHSSPKGHSVPKYHNSPRDDSSPTGQRSPVHKPVPSAPSHNNNNEVKAYQKDQQLYSIPVVKCATDLYNLPVSGMETTSTEEESPVDEEQREGTAKEEDDAPMQWPVMEQSNTGSNNFKPRPAGMERGTVFEAISSGNDRSPLRQVRTVPESVRPSQDQNVAGAVQGNLKDMSVPAEAQREESPLSIPDLDDEEDAFHDADEDDVPSSFTRYQVNNEGDTVQVKSQQASSRMPFRPMQLPAVSLPEVEQEPTGGRFYMSPKVSVANEPKMRQPDQARYRPPRMRGNLPPRFRKQQGTSVDDNRSRSPASEMYSNRSTMSQSTHPILSNGFAGESGSESSSTASTGRSSSPSVVRAKTRVSQNLVSATGQNGQSPATFGEMIATLSGTNNPQSDIHRASPSAAVVDDIGSGAEPSDAPQGFGSHILAQLEENKATVSSSGNDEDEAMMSRYEDMVAQRSRATGIGRGRARTLAVNVQQMPARRRPKVRKIKRKAAISLLSICTVKQ